MAIIARASTHSGEAFVPAPVGMHRAVCVDAVDLGMVPGTWGEKHKVRLIWQTEALMPDGKPYLVDQRYTLSLDERSNLRRDLEAWRGKPFTLAEAAGFDLERLIGVPCALLIIHKSGKEPGKVFANIQAVLPKQPGAELKVRDYTRVIHRANNAAAAPAQAPQAAPRAPQPIGPSYAPPPTGYVPPQATGHQLDAGRWSHPQPEREPGSDDGDPFAGSAPTLAASDIPF